MITKWVFIFLLVALLMYYVSDELPYNHPFMNNETIRMGGMNEVKVLSDASAKIKEDDGSFVDNPWTS